MFVSPILDLFSEKMQFSIEIFQKDEIFRKPTLYRKVLRVGCPQFHLFCNKDLR